MTRPPKWAIDRGGKEVEPGVEIRYNADRTIDEILFKAAGAFFHLEQMDAGTYWIGINWTDDEGVERMQHITIAHPKNQRIYPTVYR